MGNVYLAEDTELYRKVAIKAIKPELLANEEVQKRIEYECRMHAAIRSHPHIVTLYDRVVDGANILLIMEYVEGTTLSELIKSAQDNNKAMPLALAVTVLCQLLSALQAIHGYGIIHRDIKPSNILVNQASPDNPRAKLMDFGIAKNAAGYEEMTRLTQIDTGGPGTPAYMAPERIDPETFGEICPATDLYSVGIIFYELLCLKPPFQGTMTEIFAGQLAKIPNLNQLESFPKEVQNIIRKALAKKPEERYDNADSFSLALENVLKSKGSSTTQNIHNQPDKTMLADDILDAREKAQKKIRRQKTTSRISGRIIAGIMVGTALLLTILFVAPKLRQERNKNNRSNTQIHKSVADTDSVKNDPETTEILTGQKTISLATIPPGQPTEKNGFPHEAPASKNTEIKTDDSLQVQATKEVGEKNNTSTAALDALEKERQKKLERERLQQKLEAERKKRMQQQITAKTRRSSTPPKLGRPKRTRRSTSQKKKPAGPYLTPILGQ